MRITLLSFVIITSLNTEIFCSDNTSLLREINRDQAYSQKRIEEFKVDVLQCKAASDILKKSSDLTSRDKHELKFFIKNRKMIAKKGLRANRYELAILKTISLALQDNLSKHN